MALKYALEVYEAAFKKVYTVFKLSDRSIYYQNNIYKDVVYAIDISTWGHDEYVSVDASGNILGYFNVSHRRDAQNVSQMAIVRFSEAPSIVFNRDLAAFFTKIYNDPVILKLEWTAVAANDVNKIYKWLIKKHGARVVGTRHKSVRLRDGEWHDIVGYELFTKAGKRFFSIPDNTKTITTKP